MSSKSELPSIDEYLEEEEETEESDLYTAKYREEEVL